MDTTMIYNAKEHGIRIEKWRSGDWFSLAAGTLELVFELSTGKIKHVWGFFPLVKATLAPITLPEAETGEYYISFDDGFCPKLFFTYDLCKVIPPCKECFQIQAKIYDREKGIILYGHSDPQKNRYVKIRDNLILGLDEGDRICCIYMIPDKFE